MTTAEEKLTKHLETAHAIELALVQTLTAHISMTPQGEYRSLLERHLEETVAQSQRLRERLADLGASRSPVDVVRGAVEAVVGQVLSAAKAPVDLLRGGPSGEEKLLRNARDEVMTEALEIATYDVIEALAEEAGDDKTRTLAREHRTQEEVMLRQLRDVIPALARDAFRADVEGARTYDPTQTGAAQATRGAAAAAGHAARDAGGRLRGAAGQATSAAGQAAGAAAGAAAEVADQAEDAVEDATERAQDVAGRAAGRAADVAGRAADTAQAAAGGAADTAQDAAGAAADTAQDAAGAAADTAQDVAGRARDTAQDVADGAGEDDLPIEGYGRLGVGDALKAIEGLDGEDLARIEAYERTTKNRKTILDRIRRRRLEVAGV